MIAEKMQNMVKNSSAIRAMFEEGNRLAQIYGRENVYDFSLGNPNVPAPKAVKEAIIELLNEEDPVKLHGYTNSNAGYEDLRAAVADSINEKFGTSFESKNIVMTVGAAGGLNVALKILLLILISFWGIFSPILLLSIKIRATNKIIITNAKQTDVIISKVGSNWFSKNIKLLY